MRYAGCDSKSVEINFKKWVLMMKDDQTHEIRQAEDQMNLQNISKNMGIDELDKQVGRHKLCRFFYSRFMTKQQQIIKSQKKGNDSLHNYPFNPNCPLKQIKLVSKSIEKILNPFYIFEKHLQTNFDRGGNRKIQQYSQLPRPIKCIIGKLMTLDVLLFIMAFQMGEGFSNIGANQKLVADKIRAKKDQNQCSFLGVFPLCQSQEQQIHQDYYSRQLQIGKYGLSQRKFQKYLFYQLPKEEKVAIVEGQGQPSSLYPQTSKKAPKQSQDSDNERFLSTNIANRLQCIKNSRHSIDNSAYQQFYQLKIKGQSSRLNLNLSNSFLGAFAEWLAQTNLDLQLYLQQSSQPSTSYQNVIVGVLNNQGNSWRNILNINGQLSRHNYHIELIEMNGSHQINAIKFRSIFQFQLFLESCSGIKNVGQYNPYCELLKIYHLVGSGSFFRQTTIIFKAVQYSLMQINSNLDMYQLRCRKLLSKIVYLFQYKTFKKEQIANVLFPQLVVAINTIARRLQLPTVGSLYSFFKDYIRKHRMGPEDEDAMFLQKFRQYKRISFKIGQDQTFIQQLSKFIKRPAENNYPTHITEDSQPRNGTENNQQRLANPSHNQHNQGEIILKDLQQVDTIGKLKFYKADLSDIIRKIQHSIGSKFGSFESYGSPHRKNSFFQNIEQEELPNAACLGCSQFFYYGWNITDNSVKRTPVATFSSISDLQQLKPRILEVLCSFLNSKGGNILFDIKKKLQSQLAIGKQMNEQMKANVVDKLTQMIKENIYSTQNLSRTIDIEFVPLCQNPFGQAEERPQRVIEESGLPNFKEHLFLSEVYVTRIRVCPQSDTLYFVKGKSFLDCFIENSGAPILLNSRQIFKLKSRKQTLTKKLKQQGFIVHESPRIFDHQCQKLASTSFRRKRDKSNNENDKQFTYTEMCMIVAKQKNLPLIKKRLVDHGFRCSIELRFIKQKFSSAKHTALLYIDASFEQILKKISFNQEFNINNKSLLAIRIQYHVKLQGRAPGNILSQQQFLNIKQWLLKEFGNQQLSLYEYSYSNMEQYYLQTLTKSGCLFVYYFLNHYNEKCSLKQPKGLSKLSEEEKSRKWKRLFSSCSN